LNLEKFARFAQVLQLFTILTSFHNCLTAFGCTLWLERHIHKPQGDSLMNPKQLKTATFVCLFLFTSFTTALAQTQTATPEAQAADALFQAQKWEESIKAYDAITKSQPANNRAWYRLAYALQATGKYNEAVEAYQKIAAGNNPTVLYNLACAYARLNQKDKAFEWLTKAVNAGFAQTAQLNSDPDLAGLRDDARFKELQASMAKLTTPCLFSPEHRQFDFWIGEWDVMTPQGQLAGTNSVQRVVDGCVIFENWTGAQGGNGKSFNYYDKTDGKWHQLWVGNGGGAINFSGIYKDGAMRYEAVSVAANGGKALQRMTFFKLEGDKVRQLWETSTDDGKTWSVSFDGMYVKKK
jgi:tetratricopeptide (TPR) repeat protein